MLMRRVAESLVPPWLVPLLTTPFFSICSQHSDAARSECNMFCLDCPESAGFCFYCRSDNHADHRVIQIRRSSYHDVVRVAEIQKVLDISGVQTYVINSARVLFLNERPQPRAAGKGGGGAPSPHACEICARSLLDPFRFCSLGCKLVGIKRNGDASFVLRDGGEGSGSGGGGGGGGGGSEVTGDHHHNVRGSREGQDIRIGSTPPKPPTPPSSSSSSNNNSNSSSSSRRRKGIPHRAPFSSEQ